MMINQLHKLIAPIKFVIHCIPAVCAGLIPIPSFVMMALVAGGTLNYKQRHQ